MIKGGSAIKRVIILAIAGIVVVPLLLFLVKWADIIYVAIDPGERLVERVTGALPSPVETRIGDVFWRDGGPLTVVEGRVTLVRIDPLPFPEGLDPRALNMSSAALFTTLFAARQIRFERLEVHGLDNDKAHAIVSSSGARARPTDPFERIADDVVVTGLVLRGPWEGEVRVDRLSLGPIAMRPLPFSTRDWDLANTPATAMRDALINAVDLLGPPATQ